MSVCFFNSSHAFFTPSLAYSTLLACTASCITSLSNTTLNLPPGSIAVHVCPVAAGPTDSAIPSMCCVCPMRNTMGSGGRIVRRLLVFFVANLLARCACNTMIMTRGDGEARMSPDGSDILARIQQARREDKHIFDKGTRLTQTNLATDRQFCSTISLKKARQPSTDISHDASRSLHDIMRVNLWHRNVHDLFTDPLRKWPSWCNFEFFDTNLRNMRERCFHNLFVDSLLHAFSWDQLRHLDGLFQKIEVHPHFARRSAVALVFVGPTFTIFCTAATVSPMLGGSWTSAICLSIRSGPHFITYEISYTNANPRIFQIIFSTSSSSR